MGVVVLWEQAKSAFQILPWWSPLQVILCLQVAPGSRAFLGESSFFGVTASTHRWYHCLHSSPGMYGHWAPASRKGIWEVTS